MMIVRRKLKMVVSWAPLEAAGLSWTVPLALRPSRASISRA